MYGAIKNGIIFVSIFILSTCDDKDSLRDAVNGWQIYLILNYEKLFWIFDFLGFINDKYNEVNFLK